MPDTSLDTVPATVGVLYLVATPIGNLEDITARALRILREANVIAAEDTRVTRKLLAHFDIHTPLTSYHAHTSDRKAASLLDRLLEGDTIALVSDAGTPCLSDPGAELVEAAVEAGVTVIPVPGASALLSALVASGLPTGRFVFEGFLPRTKPDRRERVQSAVREERTVVFYEAPNRLLELLDDLAKEAGSERRVVVGRELTKKFEEFVRGTLAEVAHHFRETAPRGECVVLMEGAAAGTQSAENEENTDPEALARAALAQGQSPRDAARNIAQVTGLPRNVVYGIVLKVQGE